MSGAAAPVTFGPGSLESIRLERRVTGARRYHFDRHVDARVRGTFRVYCGNGNEHTATIAGQWSIVSYPERPHARGVETVADFTNADELAHELVQMELEGWTDPCEVEE